jgi:hypothetical protein
LNSIFETISSFMFKILFYSEPKGVGRWNSSNEASDQ